MSSRRRAFTLIELLVSIALAVLVLLVASAGFRMASQAIATMNRLSRENALLRTGYFVVTEDADFWHSHANPDFPYAKGFMSDEVPGEDGSGNNLANVRLFREVAFKQGSHFDPNWPQPNDRRSWYRNHLVQGPRPFNYPKTDQWSYRPWPAIARDGSYGFPKVEAVGAGGVVEEIEQAWPETTYRTGGKDAWPIGWEPRNVFGDYSMVSNLGDEHRPDRRTTSAGGDEDKRNRERGARPALQWDLFKQLGHTGVYAYMPPGTMNLILRPNRNADGVDDDGGSDLAKIGRAEFHFDKGEVPWSLGPPRFATDSNGKEAVKRERKKDFVNPYTKLQEERITDYRFQPRSVSVPKPNQAKLTAADIARGHYFYGMPGRSDDDTTIAAGTSRPHWLIDLDTMFDGRARDRMGTNVALLPGMRMVPTDWKHTQYTPTPLLDLPNADPWRSLSGWYNDWIRYKRDYSTDLEREQFDFVKQGRDNTSITWLLPEQITDASKPELAARPDGLPAMSTAIMRCVAAGHDVATCSVRLEDAVAGARAALGFRTIATTLRGARQHWGWRSHHDRPGMKRMGDVYAP